MQTFISTLLLVVLLAVGVSAQRPPAPGTAPDVAPQPTTWVPFQSVLEENGVTVGRFWRDAEGSTRLERSAPDAEGRTIIIENVTSARYYVYRPATGWTAQPMLLPTTGWHPREVQRSVIGTPVAEPIEGYTAHERATPEALERVAAGLNFLPLVRQRSADGVTERHRNVTVGDVPASHFEPPGDAAVTVLDTPGGIVARPASKGGDL
jgi:hypothetical protein